MPGYKEEMEKANEQLKAMAEQYEEAREIFFDGLNRMNASLERGDLKEAKSIWDMRIEDELAKIPDDVTAEQIALMDDLEDQANVYSLYIYEENDRIQVGDNARLAEKAKRNEEYRKLEEARDNRLEELRKNNIDANAVLTMAVEYAEKSSQATDGFLPANNWHATDDLNVLNEHIQTFGNQIKHFGDRAKGLETTLKQLESIIKAQEPEAKKDAAEKKKIEKELAKLAEEEKKIVQAFQEKKEQLENDMKLVDHSFYDIFSSMKRDKELRGRISELAGKEDVDAIFSVDRIRKEATEGKFDDIKVDKDCPKELADFIAEKQEDVNDVKDRSADSMTVINQHTDTRAFRNKFAGFVKGMKAIANEDPKLVAALDEFSEKHPNEEPMIMDDKLDPYKLIDAASSLESGKITTVEQLNNLSYLYDYRDSIKKMLDSIHPDLPAPAKKILNGMKEGFEAIQTIAKNRDLENDVSMGLVGGSKMDAYKDQIRQKANEILESQGEEMIDRAKAVYQNQYASRTVPQNKEMAENKAKQAELHDKLQEIAMRENTRQTSIKAYDEAKAKKEQWGKDIEALESAKQLAFAKIKQIKATKEVEVDTKDMQKQRDEFAKKDAELKEVIDIQNYKIGKIAGFSKAIKRVAERKTPFVNAAKAYMEAKEHAKSVNEKALAHYAESKQKIMDACFAKEDQLFQDLKNAKSYLYDTSEYKEMMRSIDEYQKERNKDKNMSLEKYEELSHNYMEKVNAYITAKNGTHRRMTYGQARMDAALGLQENHKDTIDKMKAEINAEKEIQPVQDPKVKLSLFTEAEVLDKAGVPMYNAETVKKMKDDMEKARENGEPQKKEKAEAKEAVKDVSKAAENAEKQAEVKAL